MVRIFYQTLYHHAALRGIILVYGLTAAMTFSLVWFTQPYQMRLGLPIGWFGVANAVFMFGMMAASRSAYLLEKRLDDRIFLALIPVTVLAMYGLLGVGISTAGMLFLLIGRSAYGAMDTLSCDMINRLTSSDRRATVLSMRSFIYNLIFAAASPLLGSAVGLFSLDKAILLVGAGASIILLPLAIMLKNAWKELPA